MTKTTRETLDEEVENVTDLICTFMDGAGVIDSSCRNTIRQSFIKVVESALNESQISGQGDWGYVTAADQQRENIEDILQSLQEKEV